VLLAFTTSIFSLSIALIPFIASRIVRGDVGSTMMTMVNAMTTTASAVAGLAAASIIGVGEGAHASQAAGGGTAPSPPPAGAGVASLGKLIRAATCGRELLFRWRSHGSCDCVNIAIPNSTTGQHGRGSKCGCARRRNERCPVVGDNICIARAPSVPPRRSSTGPGQYRGFNVPHAVAWYVGYSMGSAYRGVKGGDS